MDGSVKAMEWKEGDKDEEDEIEPIEGPLEKLRQALNRFSVYLRQQITFPSALNLPPSSPTHYHPDAFRSRRMEWNGIELAFLPHPQRHRSRVHHFADRER
jgi:hypothetical protein